jgi:hypothetical protein
MSALPRFRCVMLRRSGASDIRVIRAESEEAARAQLAAAGLDPVSVEPIGPSLFDRLRERIGEGGLRLPAWRPDLPPFSRDLWWPALLILATIPVTTALGAWTLAGITRWQIHQLRQQEAPALAVYRSAAAIERARPRAEAAMAAPALTSLASRLSAVLPEDAGLAGIALDDTGVLSVEIESADPDRLRTELAKDPLLGSLGETGQAMTDGGTMRVSLKGRIR